MLAIVAGNQANVAMMRHRYDQALALAERSVALHEQFPPGHGLAVALATLGQICIHLGTLTRAESVLQRALELRRDLLFHETTGAIFDSLAQIHLIRGAYEQAEDDLRQAREAYGDYGEQTPRWYDWSLRLLDARLALRRGALDDAVARADAIVEAPLAPPADVINAQLIAADALLEAGRTREAEHRIDVRRSAHRRAGHAGRLGRVPPRARRVARADGARERGVSRSRAEQQRLRAARRTLRGGAQSPRARTDGRARRRTFDRAAVLWTRPAPRSTRSARRAISRTSRARAPSCPLRAPASSSARRRMPTT